MALPGFPAAFFSDLAGNMGSGKADTLLVKRQSAMPSAVRQLASGAVNFANAFLSGKPDEVAKALEDMVGGAFGFPGAFFDDIGSKSSSPSAESPSAPPALVKG